IIGALAIIAGSTAAVTIHSNSKSLTTSPTKASSDNNNPNSTSSSRNDSGIGTTNSNSSSNNNGPNTKNQNGTTSGKHGSNSNNNTSGSNSNNSGSTGPGPAPGPGPVQTNPKNTQPEPSPTSTNSNSDKTIVSKLDSLLNSSINVANYDSMNTLTPTQALNEQTNLTNAIRQAILNQISQSPFEVDGNSYNPFQIVGEINVKLPNANSLNSNYSAQIQGVTLSYNGISLKTSDGDSTFTIIGFKQSSYETYIENSILN
ncbi:hypothetical protein J6P52_05500, partial [bacterium]|nr:hypothetical protein [bacterium]